jgi:ribosomal protein L32
VTPSRKKIRNNDPSKRLKNIVHFQDCPMCGDKKLRHRLCMSCFKKGTYFV